MLYALIPFLPLFAFLIVGIGEQWIKDRAHLVAVPAMVGSFLLSLLALHDVATGQAINVPLYTWLTSGNLDIHIGISIDRLTAVMLILVTTVSTLVHIYTIGYMHGEPGYARFFAYIALFTFSMLMLVMADNLLQLFVFWEAVGLCSYLLIGHWYERASACAAAAASTPGDTSSSSGVASRKAAPSPARNTARGSSGPICMASSWPSIFSVSLSPPLRTWGGG